MAWSHRRHLTLLGCLFAAEWALLAISPVSRQDWALENALVFPFLTAIALTYRRLPFSRDAFFLFDRAPTSE